MISCVKAKLIEFSIGDTLNVAKSRTPWPVISTIESINQKLDYKTYPATLILLSY